MATTPSMSARYFVTQGREGFFKGQGQKDDDKHAKDLAKAIGIDPRDKKAVQNVKKNLEKVVESILETSTDYEGILKELSMQLSRYRGSKAAEGRFQPKKIKELTELEGELKEIVKTMGMLASQQKVPEASLAALAPLMTKVAASVTAIQAGEWGNLAVKQAMEDKGLGRKSNLDALAKAYQKNSSVLGTDFKKFMQENSKLIRRAASDAKDKFRSASLKASLGPMGPVVEKMLKEREDSKTKEKRESKMFSKKDTSDRAILKELRAQTDSVEEQAASAKAQARNADSVTNAQRMFQVESHFLSESSLDIAEKSLTTLKSIDNKLTIGIGLLGSIDGTMKALVLAQAVDALTPGGIPIPGGGTKGKPKPGTKPGIPKGRIALGAGGLALAGASMFADDIFGEDSTASKVLGSNTATFAGLGAMFGPVGLGVGAALGAGLDVGSAIYDWTQSDTVQGTAKQAMSNVSGAIQSTKNFFGDVSGYNTVGDVLKDASAKTGVPYDLLATFASIESGFNPNAQAKTSSAGGLFQFIDSTWNSMVDKYGKQFGIGRGDKMNPRANAIMGGMFLKDNMEYMNKQGLPVDANSLYMAHFMGPAGAASFLKAAQRNPNGSAVEAAGTKVANANRSIFYRPDGSERTIKEVLGLMSGKVARHASAGSSALTMSLSGPPPGSPARQGVGESMGAPPSYGATMGKAAATPAASGSSMGAAVAAPAAAVTRATPAGAVAAPTPPAAPAAAPPLMAAGDSAPDINIDKIPMFVDDSGLVIITMGGLG